MAGQTTIIDASVGFKWLAEEEGSSLAVHLLEEHMQGQRHLIVPDLFFYELLNAVRFKPVDENIIAHAIADIGSFQLTHVEVSFRLLDHAAKLALQYGLTIYDATYLALAEIKDCELITSLQ